MLKTQFAMKNRHYSPAARPLKSNPNNYARRNSKSTKNNNKKYSRHRSQRFHSDSLTSSSTPSTPFFSSQLSKNSSYAIMRRQQQGHQERPGVGKIKHYLQLLTWRRPPFPRRRQLWTLTMLTGEEGQFYGDYTPYCPSGYGMSDDPEQNDGPASTSRGSTDIDDNEEHDDDDDIDMVDLDLEIENACVDLGLTSPSLFHPSLASNNAPVVEPPVETNAASNSFDATSYQPFEVYSPFDFGSSPSYSTTLDFADLLEEYNQDLSPSDTAVITSTALNV
ncbi:hypothetical protein BDR26DRAFT_942576 [Obelidium mucronatum]|nr:hypothetical protein BDR26DRAFT_942576 [Obelidium mucronatum]